MSFRRCKMAMMSASAGVMTTLRRAIVGLRKHDQSDVIIEAKFVDCIVNYFLSNKISVNVSCELRDNMLILSPSSETDENSVKKSDLLDCTKKFRSPSVLLQHSPECPVMLLDEPDVTQLSDKFADQGVYVGVAVILESLDNKILLTQRPDHMRTFPRAWVPPGGHLEYGEDLLDGALRELKEETGLKFDASESKVQLVCLWESVYPFFLGLGTPRNHHIVAYFHLHAQETWQQLQEKIELDPEEVQACTWLNEQNIGNLFEEESDDIGHVTKFSIQPDSRVIRSELDLSTMFHPALWQKKKIYSGTQLALHCWYKLCQNRASTLMSKI